MTRTGNQTYDFINHMFTELEIRGKDLNEWEDNFITSIKKQFTEKGWLSPKQREILERIYTEKT